MNVMETCLNMQTNQNLGCARNMVLSLILWPKVSSQTQEEMGGCCYCGVNQGQASYVNIEILLLQFSGQKMAQNTIWLQTRNRNARNSLLALFGDT